MRKVAQILYRVLNSYHGQYHQHIINVHNKLIKKYTGQVKL